MDRSAGTGLDAGLDPAASPPPEVPIGAPEDLGGLRRLAKAGAIGVLGAFGTALFGWLRTKGLAVALGPAGLGLYGQVWSFVLYAGQIAGLGIGVGATALIASEYERGDRQGLALASSLTLVLPALGGVVALVITLLAAPVLTHLFLNSTDVVLFGLAAFSIPFAAVQTPMQHVIQGLEDVVGQTIAYLIYGAGFTAFAVAGAFIGDVEGAAIGLTLGNILLAAIYVFRSRQLLGRAGTTLNLSALRLREAVRSDSGRTLLRVGGASLAIAVAFGAADLGVRTVLLKTYGDSTAGYWHALLLLSVQFVAVLAGALSWLTAPLTARLGQRGDRDAVGKVIDDSLRLVCLVVLPALALICALRDPVVKALFSSEFSRISDLIPAQLAGDAMRSIGWTLGVALVPLGYTRAWVFIGVGASLIFGVLGGILAAENGLDGAVTAWVVMWAFALIATTVVVIREGHWRPSGRSAFGLLVGATALIGASLAPGVPGVVLCLAAFGAMFRFTIHPNERRATLASLRSFLRA
jgi:O-antigen/teichoic acid export membrane protein